MSGEHSYVTYVTCETYTRLTLLTSYRVVLLSPDIGKQQILAMMSGLAAKFVLIVEQRVKRDCLAVADGLKHFDSSVVKIPSGPESGV